MQLANEFLARGFKFLPVDLYKSDARLFLPENGKMRLPFGALPGLGEAAAQSLQSAKAEGEMPTEYSQDFPKRTKCAFFEKKSKKFDIFYIFLLKKSCKC